MNQSTITLLIYILLLAPAMIVGFVFARRKMFAPYHKYTMTAITIFNWILILVIMARSYAFAVAPAVPEHISRVPNLVPTIHLMTGGLAQLIATYLVILMWTERTSLEGIIPSALRVRRIKPIMRLTLGLWLTTVVLGLGIYLIWGQDTPETRPGIPPVATEEVTLESTAEVTPGPESTEGASPASTEAASPVETESAAPPIETESVEPAEKKEADD